jgi:hypothetical protein
MAAQALGWFPGADLLQVFAGQLFVTCIGWHRVGSGASQHRGSGGSAAQGKRFGDRAGRAVAASEGGAADGMPGLVAAEATDALGAEPGGSGAGLVLDGDGLRRLRAVVVRLRDGDVSGPGR